MTTLTQTDDPDIWAMEFCRLFGGDRRLVAQWFQSAFETAIKLDKHPVLAHRSELPQVMAAAGGEYLKAVAEEATGQTYGNMTVTQNDDGITVTNADDVILIAEDFVNGRIDMPYVTVEDEIFTVTASNGVFRYKLGERKDDSYVARRLPPEEDGLTAVVPEVEPKDPDLEEAQPDPMLAELYGTTDAMVWAENFCKTFDGYTIGAGADDDESAFVNEGSMVGWFANAIETAKRFEMEKVGDLRQEIDVAGHRLQVVAKALGDLLVAVDGLTPGLPVTGPELLLLAADATEHFKKNPPPKAEEKSDEEE